MDRKKITTLAGAVMLAAVKVMTPQSGEAAEALPVDRAKIDEVVACILGADDASSMRLMAKPYDHIHPDKTLVDLGTTKTRYLAGVSKKYPKETIFAGSSMVDKVPNRGAAVVQKPELFLRQCIEEVGKGEVCKTFYDGGFREPYYDGEPNVGWGVMDPNLIPTLQLRMKQSRRRLDGIVDLVINEEDSSEYSYSWRIPNIAELHAQEDAEHKKANGYQSEYAVAIEDVLKACRSNYNIRMQ